MGSAHGCPYDGALLRLRVDDYWCPKCSAHFTLAATDGKTKLAQVG